MCDGVGRGRGVVWHSKQTPRVYVYSDPVVTHSRAGALVRWRSSKHQRSPRDNVTLVQIRFPGTTKLNFPNIFFTNNCTIVFRTFTLILIPQSQFFCYGCVSPAPTNPPLFTFPKKCLPIILISKIYKMFTSV